MGKIIITFTAESGHACTASYLMNRVTDRIGAMRSGRTFLLKREIFRLFRPASKNGETKPTDF
jgi:hypothetical protein